MNTQETSLNNLGKFIPAVNRLVFTGGNIINIRQLGAKYKNLTCLFLNNCNLTDLDGIGSISPTLSTVSIRKNLVSDLEPLSLLDNLTTLDVRENLIEDPEQLDYLKVCPKLEKVWLSGNEFLRNASIAEIARVEDDLVHNLSATISNGMASTGKADTMLPVEPSRPAKPHPPSMGSASTNSSFRTRRVRRPGEELIAARIMESPTSETISIISVEPTQPKKSIRVAYRLEQIWDQATRIK